VEFTAQGCRSRNDLFTAPLHVRHPHVSAPCQQSIGFLPLFQASIYPTLRTPVVAPPSRVRSTGLFCFQAPLVKSGISSERERRATDCSLSGNMLLHATPSYTSWSS